MATIETTLPATVIDRQAEWLRRRMTGIGASECAAVLGLSPFLSPLELYLIKRGVEVKKPTRLMRWGNLFQTAIAEAYSEETGRKLILAVNEVGAHKDHPFMLASPDALADDRLVEIKKVTHWAAEGFGESGTEEIPYHYRLQCLQQMAVWGYDLCDLAALIGDDDFRIFTIRRDDNVIAQLIEAEREFMDRVARQDPPLPDFDNPRMADILALFEPQPDTTVTLGEDVARLVTAFEQTGTFRRRCEKAEKYAKAKILAAIGTAETARLPNGTVLSRPKIERGGYSVAPTSYFQLTIKHPKPAKETKHVTSHRRKKPADKLLDVESRPASDAV